MDTDMQAEIRTSEGIDKAMRDYFQEAFKKVRGLEKNAWTVVFCFNTIPSAAAQKAQFVRSYLPLIKLCSL